MGILDFVNNPMIQQMQARKRAPGEIAAALKLLAPDRAVQTTVGAGTESNQAERDRLAATYGNSPQIAQALQAMAVQQQQFAQQPYTLGANERRFDQNNQQVASGPDVARGGTVDGVPMNVKEYQFYMSLPSDADRATYLDVKRAAQYRTINNVPSRVAQAPGGMTAVTPLSTPGSEAAAAGLQAGAEQSAKGTAEMFTKRRENLPKAKQGVAVALRKGDELVQRVNSIAEDPNLKNIVGLEPGRLLSQIPGTALADIRAKIAALKDAVSVRSLQDMRASNPTGGAVGQVTEHEYPILQHDITSLSENMTVGEVMNQLELLRQHVQYVNFAARRAFQEEYGADFQSQFPGLDVSLDSGAQPTQATQPTQPAQPSQSKVIRFEDLP